MDSSTSNKSPVQDSDPAVTVPKDSPKPEAKVTPSSSRIPAAAVDELDAELDALLDEALEDFDKPLPPPPSIVGLNAAELLRSKRRCKPPPPAAAAAASSTGHMDEDMNQVWSEEFIREATAQFEKKMREYASQVNKPSSSSTKMDPADNLHKIVEAATSASLESTNNPAGLAATLNEAMKNINQQQPDFLNCQSDDDLNKLMASLGMGSGEVDDADMNAFLPFMTNMMQKLLSKELLHPVLSDLVDRYPDWLADNRQKLSSTDYEKYNNQYEYMRQICQEYAKEKESDSEEVKARRFDVISELMLKVQYIGPPPTDLIGDINATGLEALDPSIASQCSIQ